jgi:hypothetical protein
MFIVELVDEPFSTDGRKPLPLHVDVDTSASALASIVFARLHDDDVDGSE